MFIINNELWKVRFVPPTDRSLLMPNGQFAIGVCNDNTKTISLSNHLPNRKMKEVLCHEVVHAAMFSYNVNLNLAQEELIAEIISIYGREIIKITDILFQNLKRRGRF